MGNQQLFSHNLVLIRWTIPGGFGVIVSGIHFRKLGIVFQRGYGEELGALVLGSSGFSKTLIQYAFLLIIPRQFSAALNTTSCLSNELPKLMYF